MKKQLLFTVIICMSVGTVSAKIITEKDIGPCTARNAAGFCVESKTHYCYSFSKTNGRCEVWYDKSKTQNANTLDYFFNAHNAMNEGINQAVKEQEKLDKPYTDAMLKEFPRIYEFGKTRVTLEQELANLKNKSNLGITVDKNKISLLSFQINALKELQNVGVSVSNKYTHSSSGIKDDYVKSMRALDNALKAGKISQAEYNEGKNNKLTELKEDYDKLILLYDKLLNLSQEPEEPVHYWLEKNYSQENQNSENSKNTDTSPDISNKIQKINNHLNNGINMINNTMNGVNSVRSKFGI